MNEHYMEIYNLLEQYKQQSKCVDKQVACILTDEFGNILSYGINEILTCNKNCNDKENRICNVIHAEVNACLRLSDENKDIKKYAFINLFPCKACQEFMTTFYNVTKIISFSPKHKEQVFKNIEIVKNISDELLKQNGEYKQLSIAQGELCELVTTISDFFYRQAVKNIPIENILDEIVDVELMLCQLKKILWKIDKEVYNRLTKVRNDKYLKLFKMDKYL
ncbi:MAG: hypothetical protein P8Y70_00165 [Candidatus Lokiarchaeota archaeon]